MKKAALLSVSNREGLVAFAKQLADKEYVLLTTSGTGNYLREKGVESVSIEQYTGQKEILGGRVKTLHPRIHAGLLARRDDETHMAQLEEESLYCIEVAAINLYPFVENISSDSVEDPWKMVELVDIGGPTMIRAAAKNFQSVYPIIDPIDYEQVARCIEDKKEPSSPEALQLRLELAQKVFTELADYNLQISKYFSNVAIDQSGKFAVDMSASFELGGTNGIVMKRQQSLRYGENPHQRGAFYTPLGGQDVWKQLGGKELSYNNFLDFDAAVSIVNSFPDERIGAVIVKHLNPCGAAVGESLVEALQAAKLCDPRSHFGGIIALNEKVDAAVAAEIAKDFTEIVVAPGYEPNALEILQKKKNLRIMEVDLAKHWAFELRSVAGGILFQERDPGASDIGRVEVVSQTGLDSALEQDLELAWALCAHVKSNAITLVKSGMVVGVGAGQMSRIDAVEVALMKAKAHGHDLEGGVAASDAFFPFTDCIEILAEQGVKAIIVPGGAKRDDEVIEAANKLGIVLLFAPDRHFRH